MSASLPEQSLAGRLQALTGAPVELRQTHVSWVFLTADRAITTSLPPDFFRPGAGVVAGSPAADAADNAMKR